MSNRILRINITTRDNFVKVLETIEERYPKCIWKCGKRPTDYIPRYANYIYLYDDDTMTYSDNPSMADSIVLDKNFIENYNVNVNHPEHYQGKNECIDVMIALFGLEAVKSFCKCNAYKYRFRADKKNGVEDIAKAEWYESKLIELNSSDK